MITEGWPGGIWDFSKDNGSEEIMSLGIALKGPEGIVLAADSRVTLFANLQPPPPAPLMLIPASFDNATKLLRVDGHKYVAAVTYGAGAIGTAQARTAHSFLPEFQNELGDKRRTVQDFATQLGTFFMKQWVSAGMPVSLKPEQDMVFLVGGYDEAAPYGTVYEVHVPSAPTPILKIPLGDFGFVWGGQRNIVDRIIQGFDSTAPSLIFDLFNVPANLRNADLESKMKASLALKIPIQFLPLQDCVDLAIFLVRSTILLQKWIIDIRGVGGDIDVATITRTAGCEPVQLKHIFGERSA